MEVRELNAIHYYNLTATNFPDTLTESVVRYHFPYSLPYICVQRTTNPRFKSICASAPDTSSGPSPRFVSSLISAKILQMHSLTDLFDSVLCSFLETHRTWLKLDNLYGDCTVVGFISLHIGGKLKGRRDNQYQSDDKKDSI